MWIMLNDAFFSIVKKGCSPDQLLVRARRPGDIEKVFGRSRVVEKDETADYLFRSYVPRSEFTEVMEREVQRIDYDNFKDSVTDPALHDSYMRVWQAMVPVQPTRPWLKPWQDKKSKKKGGKK